MSNVADISTYLLNEFYDNSKKLNEDILLENGIPAPLLKAYKNTEFDSEGELHKYLKGKTSQLPDYLDAASKIRYRDTYNSIFRLRQKTNPLNDRTNQTRSYIQTPDYLGGDDIEHLSDYGKVKYTSISKIKALADLNLNLTLNRQPWVLDLNNMPENPKAIKVMCSNPEDTKQKIADYRFVSSYDDTYIQFMYVEEKGRIFPIAKGSLSSFSDKLEKFHYTGDMFSSKLSPRGFRADFIANQYEAITWVIIFSDYIFKTNESEVLVPEGERLTALKNRKTEYSSTNTIGTTSHSSIHYYNYVGSSEQTQGRTRYNPATSLVTNTPVDTVYTKKDTGYHVNKNDFSYYGSNFVKIFDNYVFSKNKMLNYQYKLKQLTQSKDEYIENDLEDLYNQRLEKYKDSVKSSIEEYKNYKKEYNNYIQEKYKLASDTNYKFKQKVLQYYQNIENIYKEMKSVSDQLSSLQNWDFKAIQKEFGLDTSELQTTLIDIKQKIKSYKERKETLQQQLEEHRRRIEELQRQIQAEQEAITNNEADIQTTNDNLVSLSDNQIEVEKQINSDTAAVKEFYKKRIELTKKGNDLEEQVNKLRYEMTHPTKEGEVINYTKKSTAKPEDKERILNVLGGLSALASGLAQPAPIDIESDEFVLDDDED